MVAFKIRTMGYQKCTNELRRAIRRAASKTVFLSENRIYLRETNGIYSLINGMR